MQNVRIYRTAILMLVSTQAWGQAVATGGIGGVLVDDKGKPYEGARVSATLLADQPENYKPWQSTVVTNKDGAYEIAGAPVGRLEICVWTPRGEFVNLCQWGKAVAVVNVSAGTRSSRNLTLTLGKELRLKLEDPEGLLDRHEGKTVGAIVDVGVYTENRMVLTAMPTGEQRSGAKIYRLLVPPDTKWRMRAGSPFFALEASNEALQPLSVLQELDQQVRAADVDKEIVVRVKGLKTLEVGR